VRAEPEKALPTSGRSICRPKVDVKSQPQHPYDNSAMIARSLPGRVRLLPRGCLTAARKVLVGDTRRRLSTELGPIAEQIAADARAGVDLVLRQSWCTG
jgi:hypothetical protein